MDVNGHVDESVELAIFYEISGDEGDWEKCLQHMKNLKVSLSPIDYVTFAERSCRALTNSEYSGSRFVKRQTLYNLQSDDPKKAALARLMIDHNVKTFRDVVRFLDSICQKPSVPGTELFMRQ